MSCSVNQSHRSNSNSTCKLFVGHIPKGMSQESVTSFLSEYAPIRSFYFIRDPSTNDSKGLGCGMALIAGCAFITVDNYRIADSLISQLSGKVRLGNVYFVVFPDLSSIPSTFLFPMRVIRTRDQNMRIVNHPPFLALPPTPFPPPSPYPPLSNPH